MEIGLLDLKLLWATERQIEPESRRSTMYTNDIPAWLIRQGSVRVRCDDEMMEARAGHWIMPRPGASWHDFTEDAVLISVRFRLRRLNGEELFPRSRTLVMPEKADPVMTRVACELVKRWREVTAAGLGSPAQVFALQSWFYRWLERYARAVEGAGIRPRAGAVDERLVRARDLLHAQPLAQRLARGRLAKEVGWSVPQVTRRFTAEYGMTPRRYFERRRFDWAGGELVRRERTIKEIAAELGFSSLAQFSNWFARLAGQSPRRYRAQAQV
ncbi:MAG: helix-turn-helix transcriptional regulator [Opitutaceae bacterium]|nr:helix-turn-helix transcriptional regulator [Opitutaceae bacterium]